MEEGCYSVPLFSCSRHRLEQRFGVALDEALRASRYRGTKTLARMIWKNIVGRSKA